MSEYRAPGGCHGLVRSATLARAVTVGDAQKNSSAAIECPMYTMHELPQAIQISRHDAVVRAAQRPIGTDPEVRAANDYTRFIAHRAKREYDQFSSSTVRPSSA